MSSLFLIEYLCLSGHMAMFVLQIDTEKRLSVAMRLDCVLTIRLSSLVHLRTCGSPFLKLEMIIFVPHHHNC